MTAGRSGLLLRLGPYGVGLAALLLVGFAGWGVRLVDFVETERAVVSERVRSLIALRDIRVQLDRGEAVRSPAGRRIDPRVLLVVDEPSIPAVDALTAELRRENGASSAALGESLRNLTWLVALSVVLGAVTTALLALSIRRERQLSEALSDAAREQENARAADRLKDRLLANVAHELRTPLARLLGMIELARLSGSADDLATALANGRQLARLLTNLLDLAALQAGTMTFRPTPTDVNELVEGLAQDLSTDTTPVVASSALPPWLLVDGMRLKQVVHNLVTNAIRHAGGVPVDVVTSYDEGRLTIEVMDRGPGFDGASMLAPFAQGQSDRGGLGLGLAIVQEIAARWDGEVACRDRDGGGAVVAVRLPAERAESPMVSAPLPVGGGGLVLVVEDDPTLEVILRTLLQHLGYEVESVPTGEAALARIPADPPVSLAILDWHLPGVSGPDVARELRRSGCTLPLVAVTARARPEDVAHCLEAGFDEHLAKPVDSRSLGQALARLL